MHSSSPTGGSRGSHLEAGLGKEATQVLLQHCLQEPPQRKDVFGARGPVRGGGGREGEVSPVWNGMSRQNEME